MIARLRGVILERDPSGLVVEAGGVGYAVSVPLPLLDQVGDGAVDLWIHTEVRADSIQLFGFPSRQERNVFRKLLSVQGVGPMTALAILSGLDLGALVSAVRGRDFRRLQSIPRVGRKTAERICLELSEKFAPLAAEATASPGAPQELHDAVTALENLGYRAENVREALKRARASAPDGPMEHWLRLALRELAPR